MLCHGGKSCAPFNRSLILATWFIHAVTADITTLINHGAVRHAGCPHTQAGLTNPNTIFHLNNLPLPQGRPTPDTAHRWEALRLLFLSLWAQGLSADRHGRQTLPCVHARARAPRQECAHSQPQAIMRNYCADIRGSNLV